MNILKVALVSLLAAFATGEVYASPVVVYDDEEIVGRWSGEAEMEEGPGLLIIFNIDEKYGRLHATMDVPAQGAKDIPADEVIFSEGKLNIRIRMLGFEYAGFLNEAGEFKGNMFQNGYNLILDLSRTSESPLKRIQNEEDNGNYVTWDVLYRNEVDKNTLGATIVMPDGYTENTPVVVLVSGSGQQDRDGEVFGHKTLKVMANALVKEGIGSLRYDDRGVGQSDTVGLLKATTLSFMRDALAGVEFLKTEKGFRNIGIVGHSEGGLIAYMAAARSGDVRYIVSLAGPAMRGDSVLLYQNRAMLKAHGFKHKEVRKYCNLLRDIFEIKSTNDPDNVSRRIDAFTKELDERYASLSRDLRANIRPLLQPSVWLDYYLVYSPSKDLKALECPMFALSGGRDMQVMPKRNIRALRTYTYRNRDMKIRLYPKLNHLFQHCKTGLSMEYYQIEETISEEVLRDIASWINHQNKRD